MIISSDFFKCILCNQIKERIKTEIIKNMNFIKPMNSNELISSTNLNYSSNLNESIQKINNNQFSNKEAHQLQIQKVSNNNKSFSNNLFSSDKINKDNFKNNFKNNGENIGDWNVDDKQMSDNNFQNEIIKSCNKNGWKVDNQIESQKINTWDLNSSGKKFYLQKNISNKIGSEIDKSSNQYKLGAFINFNKDSSNNRNTDILKDFSKTKFFDNDSNLEKHIIDQEFNKFKTFYSSNDKMQIEDDNFLEFQNNNRDFFENSCNTNNNDFNRNCYFIDSNEGLKDPISNFFPGNNKSINYFNFNYQPSINSNPINMSSEIRNSMNKLYLNNLFSSKVSLDINRPNNFHFYDKMNDKNNNEIPAKNDINCIEDDEMVILNYKQVTVNDEKNNECVNRFVENPLLKDLKRTQNIKKQFLSSSNSNDFSLLGSRNKLNNININSCKNPSINKNIESNSKFAKYNISEKEFRKNIESPNISKRLMFIEDKEINESCLNKNINIKNSEILISDFKSKVEIENINQQSLQQNIQNQINFFGFPNDFNNPKNNTNNFINSLNINKLNSSSDPCDRDFDKKSNFNFQSKIFNKENTQFNNTDKTKCYLNSVNTNNILASLNSNKKTNHSMIKESTNKFINTQNSIYKNGMNYSFFDNEEVRSNLLNESNRSNLHEDF